VHDFCIGYAPTLAGPHRDADGESWFLEPDSRENQEIIAREPYIVLQWVAGETMASCRERSSEERNWEMTVLKLGRELADILGVLHERDSDCANRYFIYQDLKPANIIVSHGNFFTLVDLGALTLVMEDDNAQSVSNWEGMGAPGTGTWGYKAPEMNPVRCELRSLDQRVDVYALGATMFYLLTGLDPLQQPEFGPLPVDQLKTSAGTADLITRAVAEERQHRFGAMSEMRGAIIDALRAVHRQR
jgi:serine/threonine-protein kinase